MTKINGKEEYNFSSNEIEQNIHKLSQLGITEFSIHDEEIAKNNPPTDSMICWGIIVVWVVKCFPRLISKDRTDATIPADLGWLFLNFE